MLNITQLIVSHRHLLNTRKTQLEMEIGYEIKGNEEKWIEIRCLKRVGKSLELKRFKRNQID